MLLTLAPDDCYTFSLVVDLFEFLRTLSSPDGHDIEEPTAAVRLTAGFFSWLSKFILEATERGWEVSELEVDAIAFDKVIPVRQLDEMLTWFPFDNEVYRLVLVGKTIYEPVEHNRQAWLVELTEKELKSCRKLA